MKARYFAALFMAVLITGCNSGDSTTYTDYDLNRKFAGHPAEEFFHSYGFPVARFSRADDGAVYKWASTQMDVFPKEAHVDNYAFGKENYQVTDDYKGVVARQYCELRINVDKGDLIRDITIAVDSVGSFSESRCSEIF